MRHSTHLIQEEAPHEAANALYRILDMYPEATHEVHYQVVADGEIATHWHYILVILTHPT